MPRPRVSIYKHQDKFVCNYCSKYEATNKKGLDLHIKYTHGVEKATQNPTKHICKRTFTRNISVLNHIKKIHGML